ncbi:MAG: efflux RND transporter permease subunit [Acidobacteria bacterium]|nr:efflux RND transporter permease subunit [Acidobacteriota bacterium]
MSEHRSDEWHIANTHNLSRYFVESPHIAWVLLIGTCAWGLYGYLKMPQRKDPDIPIKQALVITPWPGASAERIELLVTRQVEQTLATNSKVAKIESTSRSNASFVTVTLADELKDTAQVLDDIGGRLAGITNLPQGAGPVRYVRDFGDTATLMLTVASPKANATDIAIRARAVRERIEAVRPKTGNRVSLVVCFPPSIPLAVYRQGLQLFTAYLRARAPAKDLREFFGGGFVGVDLETPADEATALSWLLTFLNDNYKRSELHPDSWTPFAVRDIGQLEQRLADSAGDKYSYRELDDFTSTMEKALLATARKDKATPIVSKVSRSGLLQERIFLGYSQERLAAYGLRPNSLPQILQARNITLSGGEFDASGKSVSVDPTGEFKSEDEINNVLIGVSQYGAPLYLRDVAKPVRGYDLPARYLNYYTSRDAEGKWQRTRAVTLSVQMGAGQQVNRFREAVDATLADVQRRLPADLIVARTSDQPKQVEENVDLFMSSLYEAIVLVVVVSLIGFWEWRSALLMAISIPVTLLMTFGMMYVLGIDLQQVSIATLIIALGLLVDDPVVAGDAIKRELAAGLPGRIAAWLGPTKLANAILYATITNIVAYLPFLLLPGATGQFLYSLPIVLTCSLVASRVVSMTFIPMLGNYLLRPHTEPTIEERRSKGFAALYYALGRTLMHHRWKALLASLVFLAAGGFLFTKLKQQFFPKDLSYLAYIDIFLPEDAPFSESDDTAQRVETIVRSTLGDKLQSLSTFVGGGGPRFWYSLAPEQQHLNYAQVVMLLNDKHETGHVAGPLQDKLSSQVPGARIDVRMLESGDAVGLPVAIRFSGEDIEALREIASRAKAIFRDIPIAARVRDDWGEQRFNVKLETDSDRANLAGVTNLDVAAASATALSGYPVSVLREGDKQIPIVAQLMPNERAQLEDIENLYVFSTQGPQKVPLRQISRIDYAMKTEVIRRRNQFRTITVSAAPVEGVLSSEIMKVATPSLQALAATLPPGYRMDIGGEAEKQVEGFKNLTVVLAISVVMIYLALVFQFRNAVKPFIVFAAVPYGAVGAIAALYLMHAPFGFMGFLGIVSLVGVIVSHIIVLFDFIEERRQEGAAFETAVLDAGILRLRPVLITVGATVIALFPLAAHGGPLWEPMCYAQIGGLCAATFITLLLVPVLYAICVLDLKLVKWQADPPQPR